MTRLTTGWVKHMLHGMGDYNAMLKKKTGLDLSELATSVFSIDSAKYLRAQSSIKVGVIPITQGQGIIGSFSEAVASIIRSMGFEAIVTDSTDVNGIHEACVKGCSVVFFADDDRYLALNIKEGRFADNNYCTALGFISVLKAMAELDGRKLEEEGVLQIGYGIVGKEAKEILNSMGISLCLYDKDYSKIENLGEKTIRKAEEIKDFRNILDLTNEGEWLKKEYLNEDAIYVSPGVPLSLEKDALFMIEEKAVFDNLEIGTAIMLASVI